MFCLTLQGIIYSKKNSKRILKNFKTGKNFISSSKHYTTSLDGFLWQLADSNNKTLWNRMLCDVEHLKPLYLEFTFYRPTRQKFDYCNLVQGVQDMLVEAGYLQDDNADEIVPYFAKYHIDKTNPRVEIRVIKKIEVQYV
jgi:Holliday junction resolvase RusA-like endonuclease